jgi:hypothetical protein
LVLVVLVVLPEVEMEQMAQTPFYQLLHQQAAAQVVLMVVLLEVQAVVLHTQYSLRALELLIKVLQVV